MKVAFYTISDDPRVVDKTLGTKILEPECSIWGEDSILTPSLRLAYNSTLLSCNYCYISEWNRYYYVESYDVSQGREMYVRLREDVLKSNSAAIKALSCTVVRTAQNGKANLYLDDGKFKVLNYPRIQTKKFPNSLNKTLSYVLTIAGGA